MQRQEYVEPTIVNQGQIEEITSGNEVIISGTDNHNGYPV